MIDKTQNLPALAEEYLLALFSRDASYVAAKTNLHVLAHHPVDGLTAGHQALTALFTRGPSWLSGTATLEVGTITTEGRRAVVEATVALEQAGKRIDLPMALAVEIEPHGLVSQTRLYHSLKPLYGYHQTREPILFSASHLILADPIATYQAALAAGDIAKVISAFCADGCVRQPSGKTREHRGTEGLHRYYSRLLAGGGIPLQNCTATTEGFRTVVE
ncbi:MAG: hypothetical protein L0H29_10565, partial [Sinobacteraceae bacterium]|nr:hypothetical protein [Nevskiaceae bacterium]